MNLKTLAPLNVFLLAISIISQLSCSKDSDLLTDYVVSETENTIDISELILDDTFVINSQVSITLNVLANDAFENTENVIITETSEPENGNVVINSDNTITYTPNLAEDTANTETSEENTINTVDENIVEETVDTFTYTTEVVNEDETVSTGTGNVTVTVTETENKVRTSGDNVFFVTTTGKSTNDGADETTAWNIQHAFKTAKAGDVIYIKAGNYGDLNLTVGNSGTSINPIKFIGYNSNPGDIKAINGSIFNYGDKVSSSFMPLIQGVRTNNIAIGTGISCSKKFVEISNIQVKYYKYGLTISGDNCTLDNVIVIDSGDFNSATYNGRGIALNGDYSVIKNCFVLNAGAEGYVFSGKYQTHSYNKMYSDNNVNPTDYYYLLSSGAHNCEVSNIHIERVGDLSHGGHGLIAKRDAKYNNFYDCTINNTGIEVSYYGAQFNSFYRCNVNGIGLGGGILARDGAHDNYFEDCKLTKTRGIWFLHSLASDMSANDKQGPFDNTFFRCHVSDGDSGIDFFSWSGIDYKAPARNNVFKECTFTDVNALFKVDRENINTQLINCTFTNIAALRVSDQPYGSEISLHFSNQSPTIVNIDFSF